MQGILISLLLAAPVGVAATPAETRLPLTVADRAAACAEVEDSDPARAVALADSVLAESIVPAPALRAAALSCRGWARVTLEQGEDARRDAHELRALAAGLPPDAERVRFLRRAGSILHRSGDRISAVELYAQAIADAEAQGLEADRIPILVNLGVMHSEVEENERARVNYEQALALMARLGDFRYEAPVRFNLGLTLNGQQRHADAIPHLRRVLELLREPVAAGGTRQDVMAKVALATALQKTGASAEAKQLVDEVLAVDPAAVGEAVRQQIRLVEADRLAMAGDHQAALDVLDGLNASVLSELNQWDVVRQRAAALEKLGRLPEAIAALRRAATMRDAYLRNQNHERLAALEAHLRDREQRLELERLQTQSSAQAREMSENERLQWIAGGIGLALLLAAAGALLWQRRMNRRLWLASRTDPLTGLANRRAMAERLRALSREPTTTALLLVDIDHFKRINDEHGHDTGDEVLVAFGERLRGRAGPGSLVSRWGGEEFLVVLPHADVEMACAVADRLREALARPVDTQHGAVTALASIGLANLPLPGTQGSDAWHSSLQLADNALYLAKRSGRDARVCYWIDREIVDWPPERIAAEPALARSLGIIVPRASRPLREPLVAVGG